MSISGIDAAVADGRLAGDVTVPWTDGPIEVTARWTGLRLAQVVALSGGAVGDSSGSLAAAIPWGAFSDPAAWSLNLEASLSLFDYQGVAITNVRTSPTRHEGSSGKPSPGLSTRMPVRKPDSGNTEIARPDSTAAATAPALALE